MARVVIEQVSKVFAGPKKQAVRAVQEANLDVADGEFMVLVGPSGCGKSTLLRLVAGLEEPSAGTIAIDGRIVNDVEPKDRDVAMVFQNYALYPHMTVFENMAFGLKLRKFPKEEIDRRVREAAEILGLAPYFERLPKALSGGQRQRVAVGRAIVRKPKVFLFDEPLSNLDAQMRVQMRLELSKLHRRLAATMIYVTHDQVEAMTMGDRIAVMKDGLIQQVGDPMNLYDQPANLFVAGFVGSPAMNFVRGKLAAENGGLWFRRNAGALGSRNGALEFPVTGQWAEVLKSHTGREVVVGIRPENLGWPASGGSAELSVIEIQGDVELVEPMGSETNVHLDAGGQTFTLRLRGGEFPRRGEKITASFELRHARFFEPNSEQAIR